MLFVSWQHLMVLVQIKPDKLQQKKDKQTIKNRTINNKYYFLHLTLCLLQVIPFCVVCNGHKSHRNGLKNNCMDSDVHVNKQKQQI